MLFLPVFACFVTIVSIILSFQSAEHYGCLPPNDEDPDYKEWCAGWGEYTLCIDGRFKECCWKRWTGNDPLSSELTPEEKKSILDLHNKVREKFNMEGDIVWDNNIANSAANADNITACEFRHSISYPYGENLGYATNRWPVEIAADWYMEIRALEDEFKKPNNIRTSEPFYVAGHLTAMLNPNLKSIGCARRDCATIATYDAEGNPSRNHGGTIIQCHYNPGGHALWKDVEETLQHI